MTIVHSGHWLGIVIQGWVNVGRLWFEHLQARPRERRDSEEREWGWGCGARERERGEKMIYAIIHVCCR